jgi:hypothetical protein
MGYSSGINPPKMFNVCILSIDYNKNTQNSKKFNVTFFMTPQKKKKKKLWIRHWATNKTGWAKPTQASL